MAGRGRGKARKISNDTIIDSDDGAVQVQVVDNLVSDEELSNSLPEKVSIDGLQDVPGQRGVKRKISTLVPSKGTSTERKCLFY